MKRFSLLLIGFLVFTHLAQSQSDCGNCWVIDGGCDPLAICDVNGVCLVCAYFIDCDDHNCASGPHWQCVCPPGVAPTATCLNNQLKHAVLKQKLINRMEMVNSERRENAKHLLFNYRISFLR